MLDAAVAVFDPEPFPADYPQHASTTSCSPHMAARTHTAAENMSRIVRDVIEVLNGRPPRNPAP